MKEDLKLRKKNLLLFPFGSIGRDMEYALVTNFLLSFILFTRDLTAAQLGAVTAIMVAARVFDALNDPIMGNIIERTRSRWGKFKPWLLIGILLTSGVIVFIFNTSLEGWSFVIAFACFYFGYSISYTMHDISYWGMIPALTSDANARNQFTSRATLFAGVGSTLASILIPMLTTGGMTLGGNARTAYGMISIVICILAPLFLCFVLFGVQERRETAQTASNEGVSLKAVLSTIVHNDQLMWIAVIFLIQQLGLNLVLGGIGSTYIYFEFGYNGGLYSIFTTVGMSATAILMVGYPALSRHIHRKPLMGYCAVLSVFGYALMLIPGVVMPANTVKFVCLTVGYMFANMGQYCYYLIMMISIMNTVEYNEYKTGRREEAVISSLRPFLTKISSALVVAMTTGIYLVFGITRYTNQISELETAASAGSIEEAEKLSRIAEVLAGAGKAGNIGLLLCQTLIPCAFMLAAYALYRKKYTLDEEEYDRICAELQRRAE